MEPPGNMAPPNALDMDTDPAYAPHQINSKDNDDFTTVMAQKDGDADNQNTLEAPSYVEITSMGPDTARLSQVSEREDQKRRHTSKAGIGKLYRRVRPLIHGRLMGSLAIANLVLFFLIILGILALITVSVIALYNYIGIYKNIMAKQNNDQCAVIWNKWEQCSSTCTDHTTSNSTGGPLNKQTRKPFVVFGTREVRKNKCELKYFTDEAPCNLHSCSLPVPASKGQ